MTRSTAGRLGVVVITVAVALATFFGPTSSSAIFTSTSGATGSVTAASDWTPPTVSVTPLAAWVKDVVTVEIAAADTEGPVDRVVLERRSPGQDSWVRVCTDTSAPFSCAWDTRAQADGEYALRAHATDRAGLETTSAVIRTTVANQVTTVLTAPGTQLRGTVTLTGSTANIGALPHTVRLQHAALGTSTWTTICADLRTPYTCSWDTTTVSSGERNLRAVVVGNDGRTLATSAVVTVTVDNVAPSITLADPGSPLSGTPTFTTTASDAHTGVKRVAVQSAPAGTSAWTDLCSATAAPWNCQVATGSLSDGTYSFRAVATDGAGNTATSAVISRPVVNRPFTVVDVQTVNGARGDVGRPDNGDSVLFTFSHQIDPATVMDGWDGRSRSVIARLNDSAPTIWVGSKEDTLEVLGANGQAINLGRVNLMGDYIRASRTADFDATLTAATVTAPDGTLHTVVTLTLGSLQWGSLTAVHTPPFTADPANMVWTPSALVKDIYGRFSPSAPVTETGPQDREF